MAQFGVQPATPRIRPGQSLRLDPADFTAESEAFERLGRTVSGAATELGLALINASVDRKATEAETEILGELEQARQDAGRNPDPAGRAEQFNKTANEAFTRISSNLDGRAAERTKLFFDRTRVRMEGSVVAGAAKAEVNQGIAASDVKLNALEISGGNAPSSQEYLERKAEVSIQIASDVASGIRSATDGQKEEFQRLRRMDNARAAQMGFDDPETFLKLLETDESFLPNLTAGDRQQKRRNAEAQRLQRLRIENAEAARLDREGRRDQTELESETAKQLTELQLSGDLTQGVVLANKNNLGLTEFRNFLKSTTLGGTQDDDFVTLTAIQDELFSGKDVHSDVVKAMADGKISARSGFSLLNKNREINRSGRRRLTPEERAVKEVENQLGAPSLLSRFDPARAKRVDDARRDLEDQIIGKNLSQEQIRKITDETIKAFSLVEYDNTLLILPKPRFFAGSRIKPDFPKMRTELNRLRGQISEAEYAKQNRLLGQWLDAWNKLNAATEKPK